MPLSHYFRVRQTYKVSSVPHLQGDNVSGGISNWQALRIDHLGSDWGGDYVTYLKNLIWNKATAKFQRYLNDTSSGLTALVESQQTISMIERRLLSLVEFKKFFEKKRYKSAIETVLKAQTFRSRAKERVRRKRLKGLARKPPRYWESKNLANAWIETWFGWLPTVGDVQKGMEALSRDIPHQYYAIKTAESYSHVQNEMPYSYSKNEGVVFCSMGAELKVTNPNLYLASQLGLTNPVLTAVEVLPYSWLFAWFNNMNQYFKQFSVYHGVSVERPWYTTGLRDNQSVVSPPGTGFNTSGAQSCFSMQRTVGSLPTVTFQWRGVNRLSVTRGATLASLLTLRLPKTTS